MPDGTMYSQSWNYYYGPLYGQDYPPGCDQVASQRQPVTLDTGASTRSYSQNERSFLASVTLKVINPASKKDTKTFLLRRPCDIETPHKLREKIVKQYGDQVPGQQKVWIMTDDNLTDAWSTLSKGTGFLWCHGGKEVSQAARFFW